MRISLFAVVGSTMYRPVLEDARGDRRRRGIIIGVDDGITIGIARLFLYSGLGISVFVQL